MEPAAISQHPIDPRLAQDRQLFPTSSPDMTSPKDPRVARADQSNGNGNGNSAEDVVPDKSEPYEISALPKAEASFTTPAPDNNLNNNSASFPTLNKEEAQSTPPEPSPTESSAGPVQQSGGSKIFVGGLSWETDETSLRRYFGGFGEVIDCVIMRDRHTGHPRGFGFVTFSDDAVAGVAASRRHDLDGRQVEAKRAVPRSEFPAQAAAGMLGHVQRHSNNHNNNNNSSNNYGGNNNNSYHVRVNHTTRGKVFVGGLPSQCGNEEFKTYFSTYGEVVDAQVMIDHNTGNSRGFGFVTFANESSVDTVVGPGRSNSRHEIMGKCVEVKRAEPKGATASTRTPYGSTIMRTGGHGHHGGHHNNHHSHHNSHGDGGRDGGREHGMSAGNQNTPGGGSGNNPNNPGAAAAYYGNYANASLAEQYGAYYNNPQWQQYYAAMGYNFNAYPQGYNPYTYLQAYMNNVANGSGGASTAGAAPGADGAPGAAGAQGDPSQGGVPGGTPSGAGKLTVNF